MTSESGCLGASQPERPLFASQGRNLPMRKHPVPVTIGNEFVRGAELEQQAGT